MVNYEQLYARGRRGAATVCFSVWSPNDFDLGGKRRGGGGGVRASDKGGGRG